MLSAKNAADTPSWSGQPWHINPSSWQKWLDLVPGHKRLRSPVLISGQGLHFNLEPHIAILGFVKPMLELFRNAYPRPIGLWAGIHAPGSNKPERYMEGQGPMAVKNFNAKLQESITGMSPQNIIEPGGGIKLLDWYNMTDGATSYDGTHYSYQVSRPFHSLNHLLASSRSAGGWM